MFQNFQLCVGMTPNVGQVNLNAPDGAAKDFTFDGAYFMDSTGEQIYNDIVFPLVEVRKFEDFSYQSF